MTREAVAMKKKQRPVISVPADPAFKRRVERAAEKHPGRPGVSAWVRSVLERYLDGKLVEVER